MNENNYSVDFSRDRLSEMHYAIMNVWDKEYSDFVESIFKAGQIKSFLDLGANTGCVIEYLDKFFDENVNIFAFEPVEENFKFLSEVIDKIGKSKNSRIYRKAVFYGTKKARAFGVGDNSTAGLFLEETLSIVDSSDHRKPVLTTHTFDCTTLEEEIGDINSIDLCKIDVEGSEYNILQNSSFLKEKVKHIILEFHWKNESEILTWISENFTSHEVFKLAYDRNDHTGGKECSMIWLMKKSNP